MERVDTYVDRTNKLVCDTLLVEDIDVKTDLFEAGLMDSLALVNLMMELEDAFDISIPVEDLEIEDYRSIESISRMVKRLHSAKN